jgi:hypothetical protein
MSLMDKEGMESFSPSTQIPLIPAGKVTAKVVDHGIPREKLLTGHVITVTYIVALIVKAQLICIATLRKKYCRPHRWQQIVADIESVC